MNRLILLQSSVGRWECVVIDTQDRSEEKLLEEFGDEVSKVVQIIDLSDLIPSWPTDQALMPE